MVEHPEAIFRLFGENDEMTVCKHGVYSVLLCLDGRWKEVVVDDYFPCDQGGHPAFSRPLHQEIWVMLLEKAVAKAFGNYANLESGHSGFAMNLLTGAPSESIHHE